MVVGPQIEDCCEDAGGHVYEGLYKLGVMFCTRVSGHASGGISTCVSSSHLLCLLLLPDLLVSLWLWAVGQNSLVCVLLVLVFSAVSLDEWCWLRRWGNCGSGEVLHYLRVRKLSEKLDLERDAEYKSTKVLYIFLLQLLNWPKFIILLTLCLSMAQTFLIVLKAENSKIKAPAGSGRACAGL